jgi:hypothetical protein
MCLHFLSKGLIFDPKSGTREEAPHFLVFSLPPKFWVSDRFLILLSENNNFS